MPRVARIVVPGVSHHVIQRGNNRQDVFFTDDDRHAYLEILREQADRFGLAVSGWCLMTDHIHLIATPADDDSLAVAVGRTHWVYTRLINRLHRRSGHLWQNRFFSCPLDTTHELAAMRYVERNPVRARLVRLAWRYPWSSAAAHCGMTGASERPRSQSSPAPAQWIDIRSWARRFDHKAWQAILQQPEDDEMSERIRRATVNGRPLGSDRFIAKLEARFNRRLRPMPTGRPRTEKPMKPAKSKASRTRRTGAAKSRGR